MIKNLDTSESDIIKAQQYIQNLYVITKELLENALDANATNIILTIDASSITVKDDGDGIPNLNMLFTEGCTSKSESTNHVLEIKKTNNVLYGFRGQALSSISSISDIEVLSNCNKAFKINNTDKIVKPAAREKGTTIKISNIFKNCEIRQKIYYKEINKHIPRILKLIKMYCYVNTVRFTFNYKKKTWFEKGTGNIQDKLNNAPEQHIKIESSQFTLFFVEDGKHCNYTFFHQRPVFLKVFDQMINKALARYQESKYSYILLLQCEGDVNVEIDKTNVLLYNEDKIMTEIRNSIDKHFSERKISNVKPLSILSQSQGNIFINKNHSQNKSNNIFVTKNVFNEEKMQQNKDKPSNINQLQEKNIQTDYMYKKAKFDLSTKITIDDKTEENQLESNIYNTHKDEKDNPLLNFYQDVFSSSYNFEDSNNIIDDTNIINEIKSENIMNFPVIPNDLDKDISICKSDFEKMSIIGQFNNGFILTSLLKNDKQCLFIIDQHAADEIVNYEFLQNNFYLKKQLLVVPLKLSTNSLDEYNIKTYNHILKRNGFDVNDEFCLTSVPVYKNHNFTKDDFWELLNAIRINKDEKVLFSNKMKAILASKACRSSIMVGDVLKQKEMVNVVRSLAKLNIPWKCPHGRPVVRLLLN